LNYFCEYQNYPNPTFFTVFVKLLIGILITDKKLYRSVETEYAKSSKSQKNNFKKKDISKNLKHFSPEKNNIISVMSIT
jgi:hypothetical protein